MTPSRLWLTYHHYAYAGVAVIGTFAAIAVLGGVMTTSGWLALAPKMALLTGPFLNVIGVLFGLTMAFLANDTWTAHDRARSAVLRETDAIRSLDTLAEAGSVAMLEDLRRSVRDYAIAAAGEWPALARCEVSSAAQIAADHLLRRFSGIAINDGCDPSLRQEMLRTVVKIRECRDTRIGLSRTHVNPLKWLGMAFLGFLTLVSIAVIHATEPVTALVGMAIFGFASAPTAAIVLIHGNPFQRPSAVSAIRLQDALTDPGPD